MNPLPVVVDHNVSENYGLHLLHGKGAGVDPVEFFFLQSSKEALHSCVVVAPASTAHTLDCPMLGESRPESSTDKLAAPV